MIKNKLTIFKTSTLNYHHRLTITIDYIAIVNLNNYLKSVLNGKLLNANKKFQSTSFIIWTIKFPQIHGWAMYS